MSRQKPVSLDAVKHFAKVSRAVVLRRMAADQCFSSRVFWAMILWSWCGPEKAEDGMVVCKDSRGYIKRDQNGEPIPAQQKDLLALLQLKPGMKGRLSRTLARFRDSGQVWTNGAETMYVDPDPPAFGSPDPVASTGNWKIADRVVSIGNLPADPVARTAAIRWLNELSTGWKNDLKVVRTRYRKLLVQGISEHGILIGLEEKKSKREPSSSSSTVPTTTTVAQTVAREAGIDEDAAAKIVAATPGVTAEEVVALINLKKLQLREAIKKGKVENLTGLLIKSVPKMAKGGELAEARKIIHAAAKQRNETDSNTRRIAEQTLSDPDATTSDREWAEEVLGVYAGAGGSS